MKTLMKSHEEKIEVRLFYDTPKNNSNISTFNKQCIRLFKLMYIGIINVKQRKKLPYQKRRKRPFSLSPEVLKICLNFPVLVKKRPRCAHLKAAHFVFLLHKSSKKLPDYNHNSVLDKPFCQIGTINFQSVQ